MRQIWALVCAVVTGLTTLTPAQTRSQGTTGELPLRIVGTAVGVGGVGNPDIVERVEIRVTAATPAAARERLLAALKTGQQALLDELREQPPVGTVRFGTQLPWDLYLARWQPGEEGGTQVFLATDRPMSAWELWNQPRYSRYPFTLFDIQLDANGRGRGDMMLAARVTTDSSGRFVNVENFASEPIRLNDLEARVER